MMKRLVTLLLAAAACFAQTPVVVTDISGNKAAVVGTAVKVDGSAVTQPVSAGSLPLPSGAAISAKQPALGTAGTASADVISVQGVASMTALKTDGSGVTQPVSGTVTAQQATGTNLHMVCDSGCSSSAGFGDNAAFTAGTTAINPIGGWYSISPTNCTSGSACAAQLTIDRKMFAQVFQGTTNWVTNLAQLNGNITDTNSGNKSAGTLRVVLATDQPALTNKLLVTPDSVALPANQSVNVSQINGVTPLMGNGVTGAGSQRVTIASDNTAFSVNATLSAETTKVIGTVRSLGNAGAAFDAATGAAPPANGVLMGGLGSGATGGFLTAIPVCDSFFNINISTATTTLAVTGVSGRHVRVCSINMVAAAADNVGVISGTGATCATGSAAIIGTTSATGWNFAANGGLTLGSGLGTVLRTVATGDSVCIITSAATQLSGSISYAIY